MRYDSISSPRSNIPITVCVFQSLQYIGITLLHRVHLNVTHHTCDETDTSRNKGALCSNTSDVAALQVTGLHNDYPLS